MKKRALIFWFTGLSGSGKTTIANGVKSLLVSVGYSVLLLDGDNVRKRLHKDLGFSKEDIKKNNALIANLCQKYRGDYDVILVPIISPFISCREDACALLGKDFYEIWFSCGLETAIKRDVKGLYSKAARNEITNLIGYSPNSVYERPKSPDFIVDSQKGTVEDSIDDFYKFVISKLRI